MKTISGITKVSELPFPQSVLAALGKETEELNPPQRAAIKAGLLEGKSLVVASPTASGKTLIAELAILKNFMGNGKAVYLVPLKALASEKYREFKERYEGLGMKIAISVGDFDSADGWLGSYDLIIASNEKMDSLLRHNTDWLGKITLVVADEIHLLDDISRGPALEVVLTRLKETAQQIIALSATIKNAEQIAEWLSASLVRSDYRPVKLHKGVAYYDDSYIIDFLYDKRKVSEENGDGELILCRDTIQKQKQALVFLGTRLSAEATAEKIGSAIEKTVAKEDLLKLKGLSKEIETALPRPTKQCRRLGSAIKKGAAFHHAGLVAKQRHLIEDNFRNGLIKVITATPTLAFGINLPAYRVIIRDVKRFSGYGSSYIPVFEVQQMQGRAGRPRYDEEGEAVIVAKSQKNAEELKDRYILGEPEPIYSKLSVEPVLRIYTLALIACEFARTKNDLKKFFSKTFFAHQYASYGGLDEVMEKIEKILMELEAYGFITAKKEKFISEEFVPAFDISPKKGEMAATPIGRRVSQLYIDPLSAAHIIKRLNKQDDTEHLLTVNMCMEMKPLLRVKKRDADDIEDSLARSSVRDIPDVWDPDYDDFLDSYKTTLMFQDWMNEFGEDRLLEKYGITPGELHNKITNADWLLYAAVELALLLDKKDVANDINKTRFRIKNGVKEELLPLVRIRNIGRVRARLLYRNGIKTARDIRNASEERLAVILGPKIAKQLKGEAKEELAEKMKKFKHAREELPF